MPDPSIATAADYADAMLTARRAKNVLVLLVLLILLTQLGLFFTARYTNLLLPPPASLATPATQPSARLADFLQWVVGASDFLGVLLTIVLSFVLLLIVNIMLVGRLIGVART